MRFGADSAGIVTIICSPVLVGIVLAITVALLPAVLGPAVAACGLFLWYAWRRARRSEIVVSPSGLVVRTPLRTFDASWNRIESLGVEGGIRLRTDDGKTFYPAMYGYPAWPGPPLARRLPGLRRSWVVWEAIREAWAEGKNMEAPGHADVQWSWPSSRFLVVLLALAAIAEAVGILLAIS